MRAVRRGGPALPHNFLHPHNLRRHPRTQIHLRDSQINPDANSTTHLNRARNGWPLVSLDFCEQRAALLPTLSKYFLRPSRLKTPFGLHPLSSTL